MPYCIEFKPLLEDVAANEAALRVLADSIVMVEAMGMSAFL